MRSIRRELLLSVVVLLLTTAIASAQATAQLSGIVRDSSGGVLPGVTVTVFNTFNWGTPNTNFASGTFGRITAMAGDPRIMQFGIKYGF